MLLPTWPESGEQDYYLQATLQQNAVSLERFEYTGLMSQTENDTTQQAAGRAYLALETRWQQLIGYYSLKSTSSLMQKKIEERIEEWLDARGYSLEMRVAQIMRKTSLTVVQSEYYADPDTGQARETDVVGYVSRVEGKTQVMIMLVVECKLSTDKPWVLMTHNHKYPVDVAIQRHATTSRTSRALRQTSLIPMAQQLGMFALPERVAHSLVVAFGDQNDKAYSALMSVLSATKGLVQTLQKNQMVHAVGVPIVVVKGMLFESYLDDSGVMRTEAISKGTVLWRNPVLGAMSTVTIVSESAFEEYASMIASESDIFVSQLMSAIDRNAGN